MKHNLTVVAIGITLLIALVAALWKGASIRGDIHQKWNSRIDIVLSALAERTMSQIRKINSSSSKFLSGIGSDFNPIQIIEQPPKELIDSAKDFISTEKIYSNLKGQLKKFYLVGIFLILGSVLTCISVILFTYYFYAYHSNNIIFYLAILFGLPGLLCLVVTIILYIYYNNRLSKAELFSA